jgi:hypothetical protein
VYCCLMPRTGCCWSSPATPGWFPAAASKKAKVSRKPQRGELREETGLTVTPANLHPVTYTTGRADLGWASGLFRDDFFLHRVTSHQVDPLG